MTGNYSGWVQGMMEHHRVQKIRKTTRLSPPPLIPQMGRTSPSSPFDRLWLLSVSNFNRTIIDRHSSAHLVVKKFRYRDSIVVKSQILVPLFCCEDVSSIQTSRGLERVGVSIASLKR